MQYCENTKETLLKYWGSVWETLGRYWANAGEIILKYVGNAGEKLVGIVFPCSGRHPLYVSSGHHHLQVSVCPSHGSI